MLTSGRTTSQVSCHHRKPLPAGAIPPPAGGWALAAAVATAAAVQIRSPADPELLQARRDEPRG